MGGTVPSEGLGAGRANPEAMHDLTAQRTLVKSPPELWSELSELERLADHLEPFGAIRITKLEPEHTVAWEGEVASGTVSIEPSGWGTTVTLRAQVQASEPPAVHDEPAAPPRQGFFTRLFKRPPADPVPVEDPTPPEPDGNLGRDEAQAALDQTLDALGSAHHRPFSRG
jgi:hypothetical protein